MPCFTLVPSEDHSFTENNYVTIYILKKLDPLNKKRRQAENQEKRQKRKKNWEALKNRSDKNTIREKSRESRHFSPWSFLEKLYKDNIKKTSLSMRWAVSPIDMVIYVLMWGPNL